MFKTTANLFNRLGTIAAITLLALVTACTTAPVEDKKPTEEKPQTTKPKVNPKTVFNETDKQLFQKGIAALEAENLHEAEANFKQLIEIKPGFSGAYTNLAIVYQKRKEFSKALSLANQAIETNNNQPYAYNLRGQLRIEKGKIHDALNDFKKAVALKFEYPSAHYNLALVYDIYLQDIQKAIDHYETYQTLLDTPDKKVTEWINHLKGSLNED